MIDQILSYFTFGILEITALSVLFAFFLVRLFFYFVYYKPYSTAKKRNKDTYILSTAKPKVSVIIASENEATELEKNLPTILNQDYPDYEVIVVNNGSTDESENLLQSLKNQYPHLYFTFVPFAYDRKFSTRKLALTIGIKAAKGDVVLFIEPYSNPVSEKWISSMVAELTEGKDVVLGYSFYNKTNKLFNRMARFDNHLYSMQYLSMALKDKPYTGTYRNIAYRKHLFFENKGFASYLNLENSEDLFINQIVKKDNTAVALSQDSFIETCLSSFSLWKQIKKSYSAVNTYFKSCAPALFKFEAFMRCFFYLIAIGLIVYSTITLHWAMLGTTAFIFLLKLIIELVVLNKPAKYFNSGKFYLSFLVMDFLQPVYNFRFWTRSKRKVRKK